MNAPGDVSARDDLSVYAFAKLHTLYIRGLTGCLLRAFV